MVSCFAGIEIFRFWPKTMDHSQGFLPKLRSFYVDLLLKIGRCFEAGIYIVLLPSRYAFAWHTFFPEVKMFSFWPKTMDYIVRRFLSALSSLE